jgi:hypothetical protein
MFTEDGPLYALFSLQVEYYYGQPIVLAKGESSTIHYLKSQV